MYKWDRTCPRAVSYFTKRCWCPNLFLFSLLEGSLKSNELFRVQHANELIIVIIVE